MIQNLNKGPFRIIRFPFHIQNTLFMHALCYFNSNSTNYCSIYLLKQIPGVVSFVAPAYVYDISPMNAMNIISAPQFLGNGLGFTMHELSVSFTNIGDREKIFALDCQDLTTIVVDTKHVSYYSGGVDRQKTVDTLVTYILVTLLLEVYHGD